MNFDLSDEQKMLAEHARGLLADRSPYDHLRKLIDAGSDWDEALWKEFGEMGFLGVNIPEEFGGLGLSELDLGVISEELGRANAALPFFSSIVLAAEALNLAGSPEQQVEWLPKLASGEAVACFAYSEGPGVVFNGSMRCEGGKLSGTKTPVADAGIATIAIVQCGDELALVQLDQSGVTRERLDSFDKLRPHYRINFDKADAQLLPRSSRAMIEQLIDRAAVQASFEATGGAEACLHMARDYAHERQMFGRPLASFQAIKHRLAELAVNVEMSRSNCYFAAWAAGDAPELLAGAASAARLTAISAFEFGARENLQVHGGIGYTFEANCHFYYCRERVHAVALGDRDYWSRRLIANRPADDDLDVGAN